MNRSTILTLAFTAASLLTAGAALAQTYNTVPAGNAQYAQCKAWSNARYTGGTEASPVGGQSKADAFCTCMWNETPDNFKGNLAAFAETTAGASTNKTCEKYSGWEG